MTEIAEHLPGILMAYTACLLGLASPGPNILAVMGTSMSIGRREGLGLAWGVALGSLTWATLTVIGLSALLASYAMTLVVIKVVGGLYLLWLAFKAFRSAASAHDIEANPLPGGERGPARYVWRGYVIQMTNPKAALTWIAIVSLGIAGNAPAWAAFALVGGTFVLSLAIHCVYARLFSTPAMVRVYGRARRGIQAVLGTFFAFAGLKLLTSRA